MTQGDPSLEYLFAAIRRINEIAPTTLLLQQRKEVIASFEQFLPDDVSPETALPLVRETQAEILADIDAELQRRGVPIPADPAGATE